MDDIFTYPIFSRNMSSLKETSADKHDDGTTIYMTESKKEVVNFDKVKEEYVGNLGLSEVPKSNDALFTGREGRLIFVEFILTGKKIFPVTLTHERRYLKL